MKPPALPLYRVKVKHGLTTHDVIVRARHCEEAFNEALRVLDLKHANASATIKREPE